MPGTNEEIVALAVSGQNIDDLGDNFHWADGSFPTVREATTIIALRNYHAQILKDRKRDRNPQRKAMRLLRSLLGPEHRRQLRVSKAFTLVLPSGNAYRLDPYRGHAEKVTKHGKNWFALDSYCLHDDFSDPAEIMPPGDRVIGYMLMLKTDEEGFLRTANATRIRTMLWNGDWYRRLRQARLERAAS